MVIGIIPIIQNLKSSNMALKYSNLSSGFADMLRQNEFLTDNRKVALTEPESYDSNLAPHKVFTIDESDILDGSGTRAARQIGWRIFGENQANEVLEGYCDENDENHEFGGVNQGPFVEGTRSVLAMAENLESVADLEFEVAMIKIPSLYIMSLWLQHEDRTNDIFIPFGPVNNELEADRVYNSAEFENALLSAAQTKPTFDDPHEEGR